ncbi:MAG: hypothetical protein HYZ13_05795 [Acidobacteria bacterium]|nr:hypothetical protein [Acidobacteriota bacterium]
MAFPVHLLLVAAVSSSGDGKPLKTPEALDAWMSGYHARPEPARLQGALREAMTLGQLAQPLVLSFFVEAHRANPEAKARLLATVAQEDLVGRLSTLLVLRAMGEDVTDLLILLPDDYRGKLGAFPVMPDSRAPLLLRPEPTPDEVQRALGRLDQCVGAYRAAGDAAVLKVLLEGLAEAADFPAFIAWTENGRKNPNPGPAVSRGCVYDQALKALKQLRSQDPGAVKALKALAVDPSTPEVSRRELARLQLVQGSKP